MSYSQSANLETYFSYSESPVTGKDYEASLGKMTRIDGDQAYSFFIQWHYFSKSVLNLLAVCAWKAETTEEKSNIVMNLHSELGLDIPNGRSHPDLLADLIVRATGKHPEAVEASSETKEFVNQILKQTAAESSSFSTGLLLGLEQVAFDILKVLQEVLTKSGNPELIKHPYITIHNEIEAQHIDCTEKNLSVVRDIEQAKRGYDFSMKQWEYFWASSYKLIQGQS